MNMNKRNIFTTFVGSALLLAPGVSRARWMNPSTGRFWTLDAHSGKQYDPLTLHKYLYCQANPANATDPSGLHIQPPEKPQDSQKYLEAVNRLKQNTQAANIIDRLDRPGVEYKIDIISVGRDYESFTKDSTPPTISWDPTVGMAWTDNRGRIRRHSAMINLIHEMAHAYHWDTDPQGYSRRVSHKIMVWHDEEEEVTTREIENPIAIFFKEDPRYWHDENVVNKFYYYSTVSPISVERLPPRAPGSDFEAVPGVGQ